MKGNDIRGLAERLATAGGKRILVSEETSDLLARVLRLYADLLEVPGDECVFKIEVWNEKSHVEETMARASNLLVAKAAFEIACKERTTRRVTLRHGCRMIEERMPV